MDDLLKDFLVESGEHIEGAEQQVLQFELDPTDAGLIAGIFRLVHTIKGTAGFLGLERLQAVGHAAETAIGKLRDGATPTKESITLILAAIDRIKSLLIEIERLEKEPPGDDSDIISALEACGLEPKSRDSAAVAVAAIEEKRESTSESGQPLAGLVIGEDARASSEDTKTARASKDDSKVRSGDTIRVAVNTIESIMQLVSELVLTRNQLLDLTRRHENDVIKGPLQRLSSLTTDLQDAVMRARMQPVGRLYANLPRLVRELSTEVGKKISLLTEGEDTEIDRQLIDVIRDPLTHIIRNCADHGIEMPDERLKAGKPETGEVRVTASHQAGHINIVISDDGRGLNLDRIGAKAVAQGLVGAEELRQLSVDEISRFIFEPGLSTATAVTNVSGRGVGMDVVRSNIESIGGAVSINTASGRGTTFSLKIPLTLAIAPALIIEVAHQRFALPQHAVVEVVSVGGDSPHQMEKVQNALILKIREEVMPAVELTEVLDLEPSMRTDRLAVIVRVGSTPFALIVDDVLDVQEIVVKPLSASLAHLRVFSGRTILGDGAVVLILDAGGIASRIGIEDLKTRKVDSQRHDGNGTRSMRLVLFRAGPGVVKALPLSIVSRIESVSSAQLNFVDGRLIMLRNGHLMPIQLLHPAIDVDSGQSHALLVIGHDRRAVGLLAESIVDVVEEELILKIDGASSECIGAAELRGEPVEVVDVSHYLEALQYNDRLPERTGRILVASDAEHFMDTIEPLLVGQGYKVDRLATLKDAARLMQDRLVSDAVIVDLDVAAETASSWAVLLESLGVSRNQMLGMHASAEPPSDNPFLPIQSIRKADRMQILQQVSLVVEASKRLKPGVGVQSQEAAA